MSHPGGWVEPPEPSQLAALRRALADYDAADEARIQPEGPPPGDDLAEAAREVLAEWDRGVAARAEMIKTQVLLTADQVRRFAEEHAVPSGEVRALLGLPPIGAP